MYGLGHTLTAIGAVLSDVGQYQTAIEYHEQALAIMREIEDRAGEGITLGNLGVVYEILSQYQEAIDLYEQRLAIAREVDDRTGESYTLGNLGIVYERRGQYQEAIDLYEQQLIITREIGDRAGEGNALGNLGNAYNKLGQYQEAIDLYEQQLIITREIDDRAGEGRALGNSGIAYLSLSQYQEAIDLYEQQLIIVREIGDRNGEGRALGNLGNAYNKLGQYQEAIDLYEKRLAIAREIGDRDGEGRVLGNLGSVYLSLSQHQEVIDLYEQQLVITREIDDRDGEGVALGNLGSVYDKLGQYQQAIDLYEQQLIITREIGDRAGEGRALGNLGNTYNRLGQHQEGIDLYEQQLIITREIGDRAGEAHGLNNLAVLFEATNQPELAIVFYKQSVNVREDIRRDINDNDLLKSYTATVSSTYRRLADLLVSQGRILEALQVIELLKFQEIKDYTRSGDTTPGVDEFPEEARTAEEYFSLIQLGADILKCEADPNCNRQQLISLKQQRSQRNATYNDAVRNLEAALSDRRAADDEAPDPQDLIYEDVQKIVDAQPGTVLIYPVVLENRLLILWATQGGLAEPIYVEGVGEADINRVVFEYHDLMAQCEQGGCTASDIPTIQAVSQQLHDWLLPEELRQELAQNEIRNLVFALDRAVRYVPMATLFDGDRYLIEDFTVSTVTAAWLSQTNTPLPQDPSEISVMALGLSDPVPDTDPTDDVFGFNALPGVPQELNAIVRQAGGSDEAGIYTGQARLNSQFDDTAFYDLAGHHILHIATHGVYLPTNLYSSYLMLGTKKDWRISQIQDLGAEFRSLSMVVLSACETALGGRIPNTDGALNPDGKEISGIAQTFIDAGVDTVIASMWQVNDDSTSQLMQAFYGNLAQNTAEEPVTIAQAMQVAQLQMLRGSTDADFSTSRSATPYATVTPQSRADAASRYAHPYYWAPFIIIGNGL
ncbi:MAG: tetratricopeptide repeat protein [Cyanobacteria bacterium P01_A01_bin.135]